MTQQMQSSVITADINDPETYSDEGIVFGPLNNHLGDLWCFAGLLSRVLLAWEAAKGSRNLRPIVVSPFLPGGECVDAKLTRVLRHCRKLDRHIHLDYDQTPTHLFRLSDGYATPRPAVAFEWAGRADALPLVAYQLDGGRHYAEKKTWDSKENQAALEVFRERGLAGVDLNNLSIRDGLRVMAQSKLFVGIDSGWSQLAHSISRLPVSIIECPEFPVLPHHGAHAFRAVKNLNDLRYSLEMAAG